MQKHRIFAFLVIQGLLLLASPSQAQFQNGNQSTLLTLPLISQRAVTVQRVGVTDITITYHRPLVNGRQVWGAMVPYGQVWRAGANQNTTIEFTDPVTVEGKPLEKGIYGLHMIPGEASWTVIFAKASTAWGSFTYDQAEDALRVTVKPQTTDFYEALTYDFDQLKPDSTVVTLKWEKVAVPFQVAVNVNEIAQQSIKKQLRGLAQYTWDGWNDAATYVLETKGKPEEALRYVDRSIQNEERFENLETKSRILAALGKKEESKTALDTALDKGNAIQVHVYARGLQAQKRQDEALEIFRKNAKKNPDHWVIHSGLARIASAQGDFAGAIKELKLAQAGAPDQQKPQIDGLIKRLEAKQDINK
jgi:tetratricopeptide (TPR) repeat protein